MRLRLAVAAGLIVLTLAACDPNAPDVVVSDGAGATCPVGTADCDDTSVPSDDGDEIDEGAMIRDAEALLGVARDDLPTSVRIARVGDEDMALTDDYVIGRISVELDADDGGVLRVVAATVELTEGPHTVSA